MIEKLPFYRRITVRLIALFGSLVLIGALAGAYMSIQLAKREFFNVMERQFNSTFRLAENSLDIIGQMARTWAFYFAGDAGLPGRLQGASHTLISQEVERMRESAHCDTVIVLDHQGRIVHHSAFDEKNGESLMAWQIVRQAANEGKSSYAIIEEQGNFIVYGSGITPPRAANKSGAHPYIVLAGFKISDELVAKLSQDTSIGLTFVRRSAVMASSLRTTQSKLIDIPVSYLDYQTMYNDPLLTKEIQMDGQAFYASVRQLHILDPVMDGSLLLTYPRKELHDIIERLQREYLWLYAVGMLLFTLFIWRISSRIMEPLRKLAGRARQVAKGDMTPTFIEKRDEIGIIASSFNDLLGELATSKQRIERHAEELEQQVGQRTRELRENEAKLHAILDNAPVGIWLVGADKRYRFVNKTFCDAVGIAESRFLAATHLSDLLGAEIAANCMKSDQECLAKETPHISYEELAFVDGKQHLMEVTKVKLRDSAGVVTGSIGIAIDITERKEFEEELLRSNADLEQFSYAVSHDMRQPLRMISSYLQLIELKLADQLDGEKRDYFNFAVEGAKRIDRM
ncbi:MAG: PAS domain-containing protein, partial [Nitrosomonadales bacterium]|nr:PAS domain-containing protein [Nitrosomonadales bacterium]